MRPPGARKREISSRKKSHSADAPKTRHLVIVETNHVRRDEIEFFSKIGQGNKFLDAPDHALYAEKRDRFVEHRHVVDIQTDGVVTEQPADIEEISAARSDIEHAAAPAKIELEIANSLQVGVKPRAQIKIFGRSVARIGDAVSSLNFFELFAVDSFYDRVGVEILRRAFL